MTLNVRITGIGNLQQAVGRLRALQNKLTQRRPPLLAATRAVALNWSVNYDSEGGNVGGWQALSDRTLMERSAQGYSSGPILRRSGTLRDSVISNFMMASGPFSNTATNPYRQGTAAAIFTQLSLSEDTASLVMGGYPATVSQSGGSARNVPARPIWYVDERVRSAALGAVEMWLSEVIKEFTG